MSKENQPPDATGDENERPVRARQSAVPPRASEKPRKAFYSDEHPEIPKVRRASLKNTRIEVLVDTDHGLEDDDTNQHTGKRESAPRATRKQPRVDLPPLTGLEPGTSSRIPAASPVPRQKRPEMLPFTGLEGDTGYLERVSATSKSNLRDTSMHAVTSRRARRVRQSISGPFWRRRKNWILGGLLALLVLALLPFTLGLLHNFTTQHNSGSISTTSSIPISKLQSIPSNSHELVIVPPKTDHPAPPVYAAAAYLLDANSETTLYAQNAFTHLPMLSTTKLMTAAVAVQTGNLDQEITITPAMMQDIHQLSADSALFGVKQGETYTLRDILYGLLFVSGNDAALVIADALAGSVSAFVAEMNAEAQTLGLNDTHFVNPHGLLDPGQYSCARDLAVLGQYSLSIPALQQISAAKTYRIAAGGNHAERVLVNENQFLWWFPGVNGGKTGFDGISDFVQVISVERNNHHLIGVVIHTDNWWTDMRDLMNYGFNTYTWVSPRDVDASGQPIPYDNLWNYFASDTQDVSVSPVSTERYYIFTGYSIAGAILTFFDKNGGLKKFGFPLKMPVPSGTTNVTQQFQHGSILCDLTNNQCSAT